MAVPIIIICFLWFIAFLLLVFARNKEKANVWYSLFLFTVSLGYFVALIKDFWVPALSGQHARILDFIGRFLSAFGNRACPYLILQAAVKYSEFFKPEIRKKLNYLLLIPFFSSFLFDFIVPKYGFLSVYIPHSPYFWVTTLWASAYGLFAHFLFFYTWYNEKMRQQKQRKLIVFLLNLPTLGIMLISYYGTRLEHMWTYNLWPVVLIFFLFLYFINLKSGVFGIRFTFQNTMEIASNSSNVVSHIIKNDLQVIMNSIELLKTSCPLNDDGIRYTDTILNSVRHMAEMTSKIRKHTENIQLILEKHDLNQLINEAIDASKLLLDQRKISFNLHSDNEPLVINCDPFYLKEVFNNLLFNSAEAMDKHHGDITLGIFRYKRYVQIIVSDNGCGISPQNLKHIMDPFFTTKQSLNNFGLGLPFIYNVIEKHGGTIQIESKERLGTSVMINLPVD